MLTKLLPLLIATGGVIKNKDKFLQLLDYSKVAAVQIEMSNICKVIRLDSIEGNIPDVQPEQFAAYIRKNITAQTKEISRDFSKDVWSVSYRLEVKNRVVTVLSAGPDKKFETSDDIRASTDLY